MSNENQPFKQLQRQYTAQPSQRQRSHQRPINDNPHNPSQENKKIKFLDSYKYEAQADLDFKKLMKEQLKKYRKNISDPFVQYKIIYYDSSTNQINQQNSIMGMPQFPQFNFFLSFSNISNLKEEMKKQHYDEIKQSDYLIMILKLFTIEIYDKQGQKIQTRKSFPFVTEPVSKDIKYNQIIGQKDGLLLKQTGCFVTSNIIDSYANYLQYNDEIEYFSLKADDRKNYKRTFIFCSDFITNCTINQEQNEVKWLTLFYEQLSNFYSIQCQFWHIYKNIIFVVNQNLHWFCMKLDLDINTIEIYDSIRKIPAYYERLQQFLETIFSEIKREQQKFKIKINQKCPQQQDSYSCGYFTCIALNYLCQSQINLGKYIQDQDKKPFCSKAEMKQILKDLLIVDNNTSDID